VRFAAVGAGDEVDNRKAEAGPTGTASLIGTTEAVERARQELRRHACALVGHVQLYPAVLAHGRERHGTRAVGERVFDEVVERLLQPRWVAIEHEAGRVRDPERAPGLSCSGVEMGGAVLEQRVDVERLPAERDAALIEAGEEQQILREPAQAVGVLGG
jgi:hypothetical protein